MLSDLTGRISEVKDLQEDKKKIEKKYKAEIKTLKEKIEKLKRKLKD